MARQTGGDIAFLIGIPPAAPVVIAAARGWTVEDLDEDVNSTAAGDGAIGREHLRSDWSAEGTSLLEVLATYVLPPLPGSTVQFAAKLEIAHLNGFVGGTGKMKRLTISAQYNEMVEISWRIECNTTKLTYDMTPGA